MSLKTYTELKCFSTWSKCSYDDEHGETMINSDGRIIDFDTVKTKYMNALNKTEECAASVDSLGEDQEGHQYMIEFKNGDIDESNIRKKVTESLLIFTDITHSSIKNTREKMDFILVYNPNRKAFSSIQERAIHLSQLGKSSCPLYGLDKYQGVYFNKAYLMSIHTFESKMLKRVKV